MTPRNQIKRLTGKALLISSLLLAACQPAAQSEVFQIPMYETDATKLSLTLDKAQLTLAGGGRQAISGTVTINREDLFPEFEQLDDEIVLRQEVISNSLAPQKKSITNDWMLQLGDGAYALKLQTEGIRGEVDLSDIALTELEIRERASAYQLVWNVPNPAEMAFFGYYSKASQAELIGLGNSNTEKLRFEGISGYYLLDFSGELQRDMDVEIAYALGSLRLEVPADTSARVVLGGNYDRITGEGKWQSTGNVYTNPADGPLLTIEVEMDVGGLTLALVDTDGG